MQGVLKLGQIVEKGCFIESEKSLVLQLCDLCVYTARQREEQKQETGAPGKTARPGRDRRPLQYHFQFRQRRPRSLSVSRQSD